MTIATYFWGMAVLGLSVLALGLGTGATCRAVFPDWRGPLAVLARICLALCWVFAVSYVLGAVGLFRPLPLFAVLDAGGLLVAWRLRPTEPAPAGSAEGEEGEEGERTDAPPETEPRRSPREWMRGLGYLPVLTGLGAAMAVGAWLPGTVHAYRYGMLEPDTLWYHGHFSARFVQTGWLTRINPVGVDALVPFHQANRELLDAVLVLPWHRDLLLPLTNLAYLGLLLLAGWCLGARWGRGAMGLLVAALTACAPVMILSHPGSLKNDLLATTLLLAALALFVHSDGRVPAIALAGATLGLAVGTKSNLLAVVLALLVFGAILLARRAPFVPSNSHAEEMETAAAPLGPERSRFRWWVGPLVWVGTTAAFGCYWYVRNWVRAGNPLPWIDIDVGPIHLARVASDDGYDGYSDLTLAEQFGHPRLVDGVIRPGLQGAFGDLWGGWVALLVVSLGLVIARARDWWLRALGAAGVVGLVAHLVTPLSLVSSPDHPAAGFNFAFNTRYALPAVALVLVAGGAALRSRRGQGLFALATLVLIVAGLFPTGLSAQVVHDAEAGDTAHAVLLGLAVVALIAGALLWARFRPGQSAGTVRRLAFSLAPVVVVVALAFPVVGNYMDQRYATPDPKLASFLWPTTSQLEDMRIGIATDPKPYPHEGADLSNRVDYVGVRTDGDVLRNARTCEEWGEVVRDLELTHVVVAPEPFVVLLSGAVIQGWTLAIPGTELVRDEWGQLLISIPPDPEPTPAGDCPSADDIEAELVAEVERQMESAP
jgi:hypothetical protein